MSQYITRIRTASGDLQIDYNALANIPTIDDIGAAHANHTHDDRYYTESETDKKLLDKSDVGHTHTAKDVGAASASEVEQLKTKVDNMSFESLGITASAEELNYVSGVTGNIQNQLNDKAKSDHNHSANDITSGVFPIERGGTNSSNRANGFRNLAYIGDDPVTVDTDSPSSWIALGNGLAGTTKNCTINQADMYGIIINLLVQNFNVFQIFVGANGKLLFRAGNANTGWAYSWRSTLTTTGDIMTGCLTTNGIKLTNKTDYGSDFPTTNVESGRLFLKKVSI